MYCSAVSPVSSSRPSASAPSAHAKRVVYACKAQEYGRHCSSQPSLFPFPHPICTSSLSYTAQCCAQLDPRGLQRQQQLHSSYMLSLLSNMLVTASGNRQDTQQLQMPGPVSCAQWKNSTCVLMHPCKRDVDGYGQGQARLGGLPRLRGLWRPQGVRMQAPEASVLLPA